MLVSILTMSVQHLVDKCFVNQLNIRVATCWLGVFSELYLGLAWACP